MQDEPFLWSDVSVVPSRTARRASARRCCGASPPARASSARRGSSSRSRSDDPHSIRFVENRGFREIEREEEVELDLTALAAPPAVDPPAGVEIVSYAERPDLEQRDVRGRPRGERGHPRASPRPIDQTFEEWRSFAIERPSRDLDLTFLALADGRVVGVAYLETTATGASTTSPASARDWRGRGVASALKRAQIAGAHARGMKRLVTESQHENLPMRQLNEKLGYKPTIANIVYQGAAACLRVDPAGFRRRALARAARAASSSRRRPARGRPGPGVSITAGSPCSFGWPRNTPSLSPISPSSMFAWRSRFEPSGACASLTCSARSRSSPIRLSSLVEQPVERRRDR